MSEVSFSEMCKEHGALDSELVPTPDGIGAVVNELVSRYPLSAGAPPSRSHLLWLYRETLKMAKRECELVRRERHVSQREAKVRMHCRARDGKGEGDCCCACGALRCGEKERN